MPSTMNSSDLGPELLSHMKAIKAKATEYGLDFFEVIYEKLDFDTMNQIASYGGFPVRYPHWRWGMEYDKLSKRDAYGMGRIYEMVINNDPCYAYLQESNSVTDQKLVMAHVYGHSDFFKCNAWFGMTERKMMDQMANHATRVRRHIERQGADTVERFLDACVAVEHLIDPHSAFMRREPGAEESGPFEPERLPAKDYMDPFINPAEEMERQKAAHAEKMEAKKKAFPQRPTRDVLLFLLRHARLEDWQADILGIIRDEAYYYSPQGMTKVMNEGWATYWHSKLMTEHFLEDAEIIDYAEQHSGVVHMPPGGFNPYKIGVEMLKDIERRWDTGQHGPEWERLEGIGEKERFDDKSMKGREKIFEVRRIYNDVNFIDEFLTPEFVEKHQMYQFRRDPRTGEVKVVTRDFNIVKQTLLYRITNMGQPFVHVADGNYLNRGELYLAHEFNGLEVDSSKAVDVLRGLRMIWGRPVHLQARVNEDMTLTTLDEPGGEAKVQKITDELPPPAHQIL
ncbi:MAG: SpoVR family protein [Phycisphaerales bacterium]|nr:SpoVR family protein [Phycisphaerales bacterium]